MCTAFHSEMGISDDTQVIFCLQYLGFAFFLPNFCNFFQVKISAQCLRERFTETTIDLGVANISIGELKSAGEKNLIYQRSKKSRKFISKE